MTHFSLSAALSSALLALALPVTAQNPTFAGLTLPTGLAAAFGTQASSVPLGSAPCRFQQVFPAADLPYRLPIQALALRKDEAAGAHTGRVVEMSVRMGYTTRDPGNLQSGFAANFDSGAPVPVFPQRWHRLTDMPAAAPADVEDFFFVLPLINEFDYQSGNGNLLVEVTVWANDFLNLPFAYPLDAGTGQATSTVFALGPTSATGTVQNGSGLAMRFVTHSDRLAVWAHSMSGIGPAGRDQVELIGGNPPMLGGVATMDVNAPGWDFAFVVASVGVSHAQALPLQGYLLTVYPDLPQKLGVLPLALPAGFGSLQVTVPNELALRGMDVSFQAVTASGAVPNLLGSSNLLVGNLGTMLFGSAVFAINNGPFTVAPNEFLKDANGNTHVVHENYSETNDKVNIQGTKNAGVGPLRIHVSNPARTIDIPAGRRSFSITVTVAPGGQVTMSNRDQQNSISGLNYELSVN